jgi:hypothetical protein
MAGRHKHRPDLYFYMCALCMDFTPASYMYKFVYTFFFWHSLSAPSPSRIAAGI